jgi:hypothetical protein
MASRKSRKPVLAAVEPAASAPTEPPKPPPRDITVRADYVAAMALFMSTEQTRYYLNGVCIEPHPVSGVTVTATDGHRLATIHDPQGEANGVWICAVPKVILQACKPERTLTFKGDDVCLRDGVRRILSADEPAIDGKFPDWRRVVPSGPALEMQSAILGIAMNSGYLAAFTKIALMLGADRRAPLITLSAPDANGPMVVSINRVPEFLGLLMPARSDLKTSKLRDRIPAWFFDQPKTQAAA